MRVALVHDFLYTYGGAEKVVEEILSIYPQADIFALFDFLPEESRGFLGGRSVTTSCIQKLPFAKSKHRAYLPLMPLAVEQLDVSSYELVISSSYLAAKGVITGPGQTHVCYCHSPARYAWDLQHQYLRDAGLGFGPRGIVARLILHYLRTWDVRSANGVDRFVANSAFVSQRIQKVYRRPSDVIHPPVSTDCFQLGAVSSERSGFVTASRLVPYKRIDILIEAFNQMPGRCLTVYGDGPELQRFRSMAKSNVRVLGRRPEPELIKAMQTAEVFLFAAEEDFGIVPVEAMACGTPVIAYGRGGVTESVVDGQTGNFFHKQDPASVMDAVKAFDSRALAASADIREHALSFGANRFRKHLKAVVESSMGNLSGGDGNVSSVFQSKG